jgi:hypothetical protein
MHNRTMMFKRKLSVSWFYFCDNTIQFILNKHTFLKKSCENPILFVLLTTSLRKLTSSASLISSQSTIINRTALSSFPILLFRVFLFYFAFVHFPS